MGTSLSHATSARLWIAGYLVATFGSAFLARSGVIPGWPGLALFLASFLLLVPMVAAAQRAQAERGGLSKAMKVYNRRFLVATFLYLTALFSGLAIARTFEPPALLRLILAAAAAAPVLLMIRAMALLLREETDEYLRSRVINQSLLATGFLLIAGTLYGFLNAFELAPRIDAYWVMPVWAVGLGAGWLFRSDRSC